MQPARKVRDLSSDELEVEMEFTWSTITENAARWRKLRDEARHRARQGASEALAEMMNRRLPSMKRRRI